MPRTSSRSEVPFDAPDNGARGWGPARGGPATEAGRHRSAKRAYNAGRKGKGFSMDMADPLSYDDLRELYEQGRADAEAERAPSPSSQPTTTELPPTTTELPPSAAPPASTPAGNPPARRPQLGGGAPQVVNEGAGFLLGLIGYALLINFLRGGRAQARGWIAAKFLNRPYGAAQPLPAQPGPPAMPFVLPGRVGASIGAGAK